MPETPTGTLESICAFLKPLIKDFDLLISIERSGYRLFQILERECFDFDVDHFPSRSVHLLDLSKKKLLLFDDVIATGGKMSEMAKALEERGAHVKTAAFAVLNSCEYRPDFYAREANLKGYEDVSNAISECMGLLDVAVETDHMQVNGTVVPKITVKELRKSLEPLGEIYEGLREPGMYQIGLRWSSSSFLGQANLVNIADEPFTYKLRIKFKEGNVQIIPLSFPILVENEELCKRELDTAFCKKYASIFENLPEGKMLMCSYCVIYNSSKGLLSDFFRSWKRILNGKGLDFELQKVSYEDAKLIFNDETLETNIREEMHAILHG